MSNRDALNIALELLAMSVIRTEAALQRDIQRWRTDGDADLVPDDMKDMHGRLILLDARVALVNGLAAIVNSEA